MKSKLLFIAFYIITFIGIDLSAQNQHIQINYQYDAAGNRTGRTTVIVEEVPAPPPTRLKNDNTTQDVTENDLPNLELNVFPNPTTVDLNINCNQIETKAILLFYSFDGKLIEKQKTSTLNTTIPVSHLSAGTYSLVIKTDDWMKKYKVVIQK